MGLYMRPIGKSKTGFEKHFVEIFEMVSQGKIPQPTFFDKLKEKKTPTKDELWQEWFSKQIQPYETIKAPRVGRDKEANEWIINKYDEFEQKPPLHKFLQNYDGDYVVELAKDKAVFLFTLPLDKTKMYFEANFFETAKT